MLEDCTIGIDPSLRGFCALAVSPTETILDSLTLSTEAGDTEFNRLHYYYSAFGEWMRYQIIYRHILQVGIEEVAWASGGRKGKEGKIIQSRSSVTLGKLQGVVVSVCFDLKIMPSVFPIQTIKKFATDHGNASKEDMVAAYTQRCSKKPSSARFTKDWADAYFIALYAHKTLPDIVRTL